MGAVVHSGPGYSAVSVRPGGGGAIWEDPGLIPSGQIVTTENMSFGPPNGGLVREILKISGKSGLVKYHILARYHP